MIRNILIITALTMGLVFSSLNAEEVKYWELTPQITMSVNDTTQYMYPATVLTVKQEGPSESLLLHIRQGADSDRYTRAWGQMKKRDDGSFTPFSMGDEVLVLVDPIQPADVTLFLPGEEGAGHKLHMDWNYTNQKRWEIPGSIPRISDAVFTLDGVEYAPYAGEIVSCTYNTWIHENLDFCQWCHHKLAIDIALIGEDSPHYLDQRHDSAYILNSQGTHFSSENFKDPFIKTLRYWTSSDNVTLLVNQYYPGFWWILNETRYEAIFVAQGKAIAIDCDLWHRL